MTQDQKTELLYLIDLLRESTKWNVDQGDDAQGDDAIRLEIDLRINTILNGEEPTDTEPNNLPAEAEALTGAEHLALEAARLNEHLANKNKSREKWKADKVRCQEDGKTVWHPACECHQEKLFPNNPKAKKFRWVWDGPKDKKVNKLSDELWEAHENGNDL